MNQIKKIDLITKKLIEGNFNQLANNINHAKENAYTSTELLFAVGAELKNIKIKNKEAYNLILNEFEEYFNYCGSIGLIIKS